jgi:hypothetical protein
MPVARRQSRLDKIETLKTTFQPRKRQLRTNILFQSCIPRNWKKNWLKRPFMRESPSDRATPS